MQTIIIITTETVEPLTLDTIARWRAETAPEASRDPFELMGFDSGIWGYQYADFRSPGLPRGYDTVLGYLAKYDPCTLALIDGEAEATQRDGWWLRHRCREAGLEVVKVAAPLFLKDQGVSQVNAYPEHLLAKRFDVP